jgi:hypothetical protein
MLQPSLQLNSNVQATVPIQERNIINIYFARVCYIFLSITSTVSLHITVNTAVPVKDTCSPTTIQHYHVTISVRKIFKHETTKMVGG